MKNALKGLILAALNTTIVAIALGAMLSGPHTFGSFSNLVLPIMMIGGMFALPAGALLGVAAGRLREGRILVLELCAIALVPMCGVFAFSVLGSDRIAAHDFTVMVIIASGPTAMVALLLERWTRPRFEVARALALRATSMS
jgi:hypothetical protein